MVTQVVPLQGHAASAALSQQPSVAEQQQQQRPHMDDILQAVPRVRRTPALRRRSASFGSQHTKNPVLDILRNRVAEDHRNINNINISGGSVAWNFADLNDRAYNVWLQFTDEHFDPAAYVAFKRSDWNVWSNVVVCAVALVYFTSLCAAYGVRANQPLRVASTVSFAVCTAVFAVSTLASVYVDAVPNTGRLPALRRACEWIDVALYRTTHDAVVVFGQASVTLLLLGVCVKDATVPPELLALAMVFVLIAQVVFAKGGSSAGYATAWACSVTGTNAALYVADCQATAWWVNAVYVGLLVASYECERQTLRHFIKSVLAVNVTQQFADLKLKLAQQKADINAAALDAKRGLVRHIAHEVRGPLNTIAIAGDILGQELDGFPGIPQLVIDIVESLKDASGTAMEQINEMLLYEKVSAGMRSIEPQAVPIVPYIRDCMMPHLVPALAKDIAFVLDVAAADTTTAGSASSVSVENVFVKIDPVKCKVVLRNLCSNAIKFTPNYGQVTISVAVKAAAAGAATPSLNLSPRSLPTAGADPPPPHTVTGPVVHISVKDSGPGLSAAHLKQLFTEGTQFNANQLQGGGGSGLGLYITKGIVEQHDGGRIWCESAGEGHGCTFHVVFPVLDAAKLPPEEVRWMGGAPHDRGPFAASPRCSVTPRENLVTDLMSSSLAPEASVEKAQVLVSAQGSGQGQALLLRALSPPLLASGDASRRQSKALGSPHTTAPALPPNMHVLVVDDSEMNRKMVARLLRREGHTVTEADDGVAAVSMVSRTLLRRVSAALLDDEHPADDEKASNNKKDAWPMLFDAVLMDGNMPKLNGAEACRQIKNLGYLGPVIALTGNDDTSDFAAAGADGMLTKPVNWAKLAAAISKAIIHVREKVAAQQRAGRDALDPSMHGAPASGPESRKVDVGELLRRVTSCHAHNNRNNTDSRKSNPQTRSVKQDSLRPVSSANDLFALMNK